jgi:glycosyltransferase involved in cell wall biosynthesis
MFSLPCLTLNILIPAYNEEDNIWPLTEAVETALMDRDLLARVGNKLRYSIIFVDNCSRDQTWARVQKLAEVNPCVSGIRHAINYGQLLSPFMAICQSEADLTIGMCADFQDPPSLLPRIILAQLDTQADLIAAVCQEDHESAWRLLARRIGYKLMGKISDAHSIPRFYGFGLYSARAVQAFRSYHELRPYIRLIPTYMGLDIHQISYVREARRHGSSSNNLVTLFELAVDGIIQFSSFPPKFITSVAVFQWFTALSLSLILFIYQLLAAVISVSFCLLLLIYVGLSFLILCMGFILQYVYRSYAMQTGRPYYRIQSTCGDLSQLNLVQ